MKLIKKLAVVTGAASGLGQATAKRLANQEVSLALLDLDEAGLVRVADETGGVPFIGDVSNAEEMESVFNAIFATLGCVQICINCAGIAPATRILGRKGPMALDAFAKVIDINLIGTFNVMRLAAAHMQQAVADEEGERGVIINTASVAAFDGQRGQAAYSASKGAVAAMTLPIARDLMDNGIRVMAIAPGVMETPMMEGMNPKVQASLAAMVPFPKRLGKADEFAQLVQHIIENPYLNGTVVRLDAGLRMSA